MDVSFLPFYISLNNSKKKIKLTHLFFPFHLCKLGTLFDLQEVTEQIRQKTGHLPGVSVAIMGCIVNGPGEMADADFGYVGGAPGKVDLYVGKEVIKRGIPNEVACDALVDLIKEYGRWQEKSDDAITQEELVNA